MSVLTKKVSGVIPSLLAFAFGLSAAGAEVVCATCNGKGVVYEDCPVCFGSQYVWTCAATASVTTSATTGAGSYCGYGSSYKRYPTHEVCSGSRRRKNCPNCVKGKAKITSTGKVEVTCPTCNGEKVVAENYADDDADSVLTESIESASPGMDTSDDIGPLFVEPTPIPDAAQIESAAKIAKELCEDDSRLLKEGKLKRGAFAQKLVGYSMQTDDAALKFVLLRNAFRQFLSANAVKDARQLFEWTFVNHGGRFASAMADYSSATLKKMAESPRLSATVKPLQSLVEESAASCKALAEAEAAFKKQPTIQAKRTVALNAVKLQNWELALDMYAEINDDGGDICRWELNSLAEKAEGFTCEQAGDFWWKRMDEKNRQGLLSRAVSRHAAYWYRRALAEEELAGLKTALVKKRIADAAEIQGAPSWIDELKASLQGPVAMVYIVKDVQNVTVADRQAVLEEAGGGSIASSRNILQRRFSKQGIVDFKLANPKCRVFETLDDLKAFMRTASAADADATPPQPERRVAAPEPAAPQPAAPSSGSSTRRQLTAEELEERIRVEMEHEKEMIRRRSGE